MKSGNLNFLEPSGPLEACDGTALPLLVANLESIYCAALTGYDAAEDSLLRNKINSRSQDTTALRFSVFSLTEVESS